MRTSRFHVTGLACCLAVLAVAVGGAPPASATDVAIEGSQLRIVDAAAQADVLDVRPSAGGYEVFDDSSDLSAGAGCIELQPHHVGCLGSIVGVAVDAGGGDDVVGLGGIAIPVLVSGGEGSDLIEGGSNDDRLNGGPGEDTIRGETGNDVIAGADGDDMLQGGDGADQITGGPAADIVQGQGDSGDVLAGNDGPDLVEGGTGDDTLRGGTGSDVLVTGSGTDTANTGAGRDQVFGAPADTVACGSGDAVRTGTKAPPDGCAALPSSASKPDIWPPPPDDAAPPNAAQTGDAPIEAALTAQAAFFRLPLPVGVFSGRIMRRGEGRKINLRIPSHYDQPVRVRIRTYARDGHRLRTFRANVRAKRWASIDTGGDFAVVWSAKARCCVR
jgi:hypothetical protein